MKFGICCDPGILPAKNAEDPLSSLPRLMDILQGAGADYLEFSAGLVMPPGGESSFEALHTALEAYPLRPEVFNCFLPRHHRITGPEVDLQNVLTYCCTALTRCKAVGAEVMVLGSGNARRVPEVFSQLAAERQFIDFCLELGAIAEDIGIDIAVEPLNSKEDNLILSVAHGTALVDQISHPKIKLLADLYHMTEEAEFLDSVAAAGARLRHAHLADIGRAAPGFAQEGEAGFSEFFLNLRLAGYAERSDARCSFEGRIDDLEAQAAPVLNLLRERWSESFASYVASQHK